MHSFNLPKPIYETLPLLYASIGVSSHVVAGHPTALFLGYAMGIVGIFVMALRCYHRLQKRRLIRAAKTRAERRLVARGAKQGESAVTESHDWLDTEPFDKHVAVRYAGVWR